MLYIVVTVASGSVELAAPGVPPTTQDACQADAESFGAVASIS